MENNNKINHISIENSSVPSEIRLDFDKMISRNSDAFALPNRSLPYNTSVKATIKTITEEPIYSRSYPYPISEKRDQFTLKRWNNPKIVLTLQFSHTHSE